MRLRNQIGQLIFRCFQRIIYQNQQNSLIFIDNLAMIVKYANCGKRVGTILCETLYVLSDILKQIGQKESMNRYRKGLRSRIIFRIWWKGRILLKFTDPHYSMIAVVKALFNNLTHAKNQGDYFNATFALKHLRSFIKVREDFCVSKSMQAYIFDLLINGNLQTAHQRGFFSIIKGTDNFLLQLTDGASFPLADSQNLTDDQIEFVILGFLVIADLAQDRHELIIDYLRSIFTIQLFRSNINQPCAFLSGFLRLYINLYLNVNPYVPIHFPQLVVVENSCRTKLNNIRFNPDTPPLWNQMLEVCKKTMEKRNQEHLLGFAQLQCVQFLQISASFGFFGFEESHCVDILPRLLRLLEFYEQCSSYNRTALDLLDFGLKVNHSFDLIYKQAIEGSQAFAQETFNTKLTMKNPLISSCLDSKLRFIIFMSSALFGYQADEFMPAIGKSIVMWINRFLLLEIEVHYQTRIYKISDHWRHLLQGYIQKQTHQPINEIIEEQKHKRVAEYVQRHFNWNLELGETLVNRFHKLIQIAGMKQLPGVNKVNKVTGLACQLFGTIDNNICDQDAIQILYKIFFEKRVLFYYLRQTVVTDKYSRKIIRMILLLKQFRLHSQKAFMWCVADASKEQDSLLSLGSYIKNILDQQCDVSHITKIKPLLQELIEYFNIQSTYDPDTATIIKQPDKCQLFWSRDDFQKLHTLQQAFSNMGGSSLFTDFLTENKHIIKLTLALLENFVEAKEDLRLVTISEIFSMIYRVLLRFSNGRNANKQELFQVCQAFFPISKDKDIGESKVLASVLTEPQLINIQKEMIYVILQDFTEYVNLQDSARMISYLDITLILAHHSLLSSELLNIILLFKEGILINPLKQATDIEIVRRVIELIYTVSEEDFLIESQRRHIRMLFPIDHGQQRFGVLMDWYNQINEDILNEQAQYIGFASLGTQEEMSVTSLRLYERTARQFIGIYNKLYLKLGRYHKWKLIKLVEFIHSRLDILYDQNPILASKIRKCSGMKQMQKALKAERAKYNQNEYKRTNQIAKIVLEKREEQNGQINGAVLSIINSIKRGSQSELFTQKTPLMLPDLRKNKSEAAKQLSASEIELLANFSPKRSPSNLERLKRGKSKQVVSQFLGFEEDHNKYYAWKQSMDELWGKRWMFKAKEEELQFIKGLEPSYKPVWFRGTIFFAILKLRSAMVNFSTPFPPYAISRMILDTFIELHRLKATTKASQFSQINQMFQHLRLINMPFALLDFHSSTVVQQLIFKLLQLANQILNYEEVQIQEAYHEHFKRGNDQVFSNFAEYLVERMFQIRHLLVHGNVHSSDIKSQALSALKSSFVTKSRASNVTSLIQHNSQIDKDYSELEPQTKDALIREVLRFLELLNQNHFQKMQVMMTDLEGHNFTSLVVFFLEKQIELVKELDSPMAINTAIQALKTLAEFNQGPCQQNQREMLQNGFLQIAKQILKIQVLTEINFQYYSPKETLQISFLKQKLKYYCLVTLKSLMEGDMEDMVVKLIVQVIPLNILQRNFTSVYLYMVQHYSSDENDVYFNMDRATPKKEFIIEVGFLTFMIYRLCREYRYKLYNVEDAKKNVEVIRTEQGSSLILLIKELFELCKRRQIHGCPCRIRSFQNNAFIDRQQTIQDSVSLVATEDSMTEEANQDSVLSKREAIEGRKYSRCCCRKKKGKSNFKCRCSRPDPPYIYSRNELFTERQIEAAVQFYRKNSERIQILKNGKLERFEFPKLPSSRFLSYELREHFYDNLDRTSAKTKVESLVTQSDMLINEMENQYFFRHQFLYFTNLKVQAKYSEVHKNYAFYLALILNLLILLSFTEQHIEQRRHVPESYDIWFLVIGTFHLFAMLMVYLFTVVKEVFVQCKNKKKAWYSLPYWLPKSLTSCKCCQRSLFFRLVINPTMFYYNSMMIISVLALTYNHLFYSVLMLDIISRSLILQNVLRAIWHPRLQIMIIFIFLVVLVYIFGVMGYLWFARHFPVQCNQFYNCVAILIDQTFREGLAIYLADNMQHPAYSDNVLHGDLVVFQIVFHILIVILLIEILSGIIIDTFSKLREEADRRKQDEASNCFICGLNRDQIERDYGHDYGFSVHTKGIHSPLNYLYFLGYLHGKQSSEYTGTESYVHELIKKQDNSWFPCYDEMIQQRINLL